MNIDDYNQISTKTGDKGTSKNYSNETFSKDDILFDALGTNDELSSMLGLTYHRAPYENIKTIQNTLQAINALIATNESAHPERYKKLRQITDEDISFIEQEEEIYMKKAPIAAKFFLPGSEATEAGAYFDLARTVARRAERTLVRYINHTKRDDLDGPRRYLNRLSDLLFILARNYSVE